MRLSITLTSAVLALALAACSGAETPGLDAVEASTSTVGTTASDPIPATTSSAIATIDDSGESDTRLYVAHVWADNWFALYINGTLVGEDSVPITTERSFNAETITFEAAPPLTVAVLAKDFKENDTGLEYIGTDRQQMGDGGIILQIIDDATGQAVAATDTSWRVLPIHRAPLNTECERSATPEVECQSEILSEPQGWTAPGYDDSTWSAASAFSEADVSPKDGYDQISWDTTARLVWSSDLEIDNTVLMRGDSR